MTDEISKSNGNEKARTTLHFTKYKSCNSWQNTGDEQLWNRYAPHTAFTALAVWDKESAEYLGRGWWGLKVCRGFQSYNVLQGLMQ